MRSYRLSVTDLAMGLHQFRLKQVDRSGETNLHDAVTVDVSMKEPVMLRPPGPNPVHSRATLSFAVREAVNTSITVYNVLGQKGTTLFRGTPTAREQQTVDLTVENLSSGVYFVRIRSGGHVRTERMTIVR